MFESIKNKLESASKRIRKVAGTPIIWGTVAVFSPTFVACYGPPMQLPDEGPLVKTEYNFDCINGYIKLSETKEYQSGWQEHETYYADDTSPSCTSESCPVETYDECTKARQDTYNEKCMKCVKFIDDENGVKILDNIDYSCIQTCAKESNEAN